MSEQTDQVFITVLPPDDYDQNETAELARQLRRELLQTDVDDVEFAAGGELPAGAKSLGAIDWNTLIMTLITSGSLVSVANVLGSWLMRHRDTSIQLNCANGTELKLTGSFPASMIVPQLESLLAQCGQTSAWSLLDEATRVQLSALRKQMDEALSLLDVKAIASDVGLDYENLGGESLNKEGKIMELIAEVQTAGRITELRRLCAERNGDVCW